MSENEILAIFEQTHALLQNDHFIYTSGKHGSSYLNKDAIYPHTAAISELCAEIARQVGEATARRVSEASPRPNVEVVVGPALGGIVLSQWVAHHLSGLLGREVLGVYTEKTPENGQRFIRGYDALVAGKNVLVVEDVMTTGGSIRKVVDAVVAAGGTVVQAFALVNRNPTEVTSAVVGAPLSALVELPMEAFKPAACVLCVKRVPINTKIGKGKELDVGK